MMMKKYTTPIIISILFGISALIYAVQFFVFHDSRDTFFYLLQDWAFLPVQIAVVTIAVGKLVESREKRDRLEKTQMLASTFFSDCGMQLLRDMLSTVTNKEVLHPCLSIQEDWGDREFRGAVQSIKDCRFTFCLHPDCLMRLKAYFEEKNMSMLVIISNPALLEHEEFTDMLWAMFHLKDELKARDDFENLSEMDQYHLREDMERAMRGVLINWVRHMQHIKKEYPYLFLLEISQDPLALEKA
ncbi:hypothetical protein [Eubacterium barkeri]|uniref:Uncharacterized protein n=1 Tax=Eubacterium barkeri TaxID=1528 RepID=A0A1H3DMX3_EUBBA|nr:hypothetical protein [Eubacterium barkeri]SDX67690.1 hypothetical protein SAMN04488579_10566 [Eubacterium barkeri]